MRTGATFLFAAVAVISSACQTGQVATAPPATSLAGTSWRLVKFQGGDDKVLTPDDRNKYTIAFGKDDRVSVRLDCNRGSGMWTSTGAPNLQFGPLALTRAMCPSMVLHDRIAKDWTSVRSYVIRSGHLFLSLMADAGIYEFEPAASSLQF